MHVNGLNFSLD